MRMQKGIGRAGYRLLGLVFFAIATLGLAMGWTAAIVDGSALFLGVGLGMAASGLLALLLLLFVLSTDAILQAPANPDGARSVAAETEATPARAAPDCEAPPGLTEFEYTDYRPAAHAAPEELVLPKPFLADAPAGQEPPAPPEQEPETREPTVAFRPAPTTRAEPREPGAWPAPRGNRAVPARARVPPRPEPPTPQRDEMTERYTRTTPLVRRVLQGDGDAEGPDGDAGAPEVPAQRSEAEFDPDWAPKDRTRGRCSKCSTILLAPTKRPIRLKCPVCERVTLLES